MSYQINENDENKLIVDGEYIHYSMPFLPPPRGCTTYALVRHFWKMCEFAHFVVHVLNDHVNRPLDVTATPKKFSYRPKNFLTDLEVQYAKRDPIWGVRAGHVFFDEFNYDLKGEK